MKHEQITSKILRAFYDVYNELGHGFLESVYQRAMVMTLTAAGAIAETEFDIPVWFRGERIGDFAADLLVDRLVIVELKAARALEAAHEAQLLHYLRATEIEVGLLLNFGPQPEFKRLAYDNARIQPPRARSKIPVPLPS